MAYSYSAFLMKRHATGLIDVTRDAVTSESAAEVRRLVSKALSISWQEDTVLDLPWGDGMVTLLISGAVLGIRSHTSDIPSLAEKLASVGFGVFDDQTAVAVAQPHLAGSS